MALDMSIGVRVTAAVAGGQQVQRLTDDLRNMGRQGETSARQISNAMRQLPAQFQDVVVSLAGGQNPLMVLLQQGSQVSSSFGGIGNALRGMATLITPVSVAFTGLAGAVGSVAAAFFMGYKESREFSRAVALTGNFAGVTATSFNEMATAIAATTGATELAVKALAQGAIGGGSFGPQSMQAVVTAMATLQGLSGQTSEEVLKVFDGMSKGVADWAVKTNQMYNFLSVEQFKYIRQLEEQGRLDEAAAVAANALNEALSTRTVNLGYLERAWNGTKDAASAAWNAMLNIGREETTQDQIRVLERRLEGVEFLRKRMAERGQKVPEEGPEIKALRAQLQELRELAAAEQKRATDQADRAATNQANIKAEIEAEAERKRAAAEALALEKQRKQMLQSLGDEIFRMEDGELAYLMLQAKRLQMNDAEIDALSHMYFERERLKQQEKERQESEREIQRLITEGTRKEKLRLDTVKKLYDDTRTPAERLNLELAKLNDLLADGSIDWDLYSRAVFQAQDRFEDATKEATKAGKTMADELREAIEGWGRSSANAVADFVMGTKSSFKDLVQSIIRDLISLTVYRTITAPLFGAFANAFLPAAPAQPLSYADGGVMTPMGNMPLRKYARGGIATSPQLAIFGEGSMNEAYVPLPDGRSIPVTMTNGGNTSVTVNVSVDSNGSAQVQGDQGAGQLGRLIAGAVKAELINQRRPGGILAA